MGTRAPKIWFGASHSLVHRKAKPNFSMLGQDEMIRETMMPPSINSTISAASFTSTLKIMSPFFPGGLNAGLVAAISYSSVSGQKKS